MFEFSAELFIPLAFIDYFGSSNPCNEGSNWISLTSMLLIL